ncbi:MAG: hypothetical protein AB1324_01750 [Candidatus Micrarchaeota archaeon]
MRIIIFLAAAALLLGCVTFGERGNETGNATSNETPPSPPEANMTNTTNDTNITPPEPPPKIYERYTTPLFSFEYPIDMEVQTSNSTTGGIFTGTHVFDGQTGEIMIVTFTNTLKVYGENKDTIYKTDPTKAASDFLQQDKNDDDAGSLLDRAFETGSLKTFSVSRDGAAAEMPFKVRFSDSNRTYTGYAIDIYTPERSLLVKYRGIALDTTKAEAMRDNFLLTFRVE